MSSVLKGNFKTKKEVKGVSSDEKLKIKEKVSDLRRKEALNSIGGSMVYVDESELTWNGEELDGNSEN